MHMKTWITAATLGALTLACAAPAETRAVEPPPEAAAQHAPAQLTLTYFTMPG